MKEEDFDHIGKRLYDHEADPPKDGWDKIAGAIRTPAKPGNGMSWLKKKFWIPLAVLLPLATWQVVSHHTSHDPANSSTAIADTPDSLNERSHSHASIERSYPMTKDSLAAATGSTTDDSRAITQFNVIASDKAETSARTKKESRIGSPVELQPDILMTATSNDFEKTPATTRANDHGAIAQADSSEHEAGAIVSEARNEDVRDHKVEPLITSGEPSQQIDSTFTALTNEYTEEEEIVEEQEHEQEDQRLGWRLNLSFTPQYLTRSVRPIANDEIYVTRIQGDEGAFSDRIGLGFALGAGRAVARNIYLDAHLTFSQSKQNTFFSVSTGKVDTLLAVEQPDKSVRVIPVYDETHRQTTSRYSYAGIRIATTYYFLSTQGGRFNVAAGAGINYLLSASVKENINGQWVALENNHLSKVNYTLTVGAGYTLDLNRHWALMINPALTYHLREVKSGQLPYRLNQRPFGLNIMLSRSL